MFAIEIEYLGGRAVATAYNDRNQAEWPPHPSRLFSALVAVHKSSERDPNEHEALTWLAQQPPPALFASDASRRTVRTHYVPVNDATVVNQTPIDKALNKLRALERQRREAERDKDQVRLDKKIVTATTKLHADARKYTTARVKTNKPDLGVLPDERNKQARTFPSVTPEDPRVFFAWSVDVPERFKQTLANLPRRLVRLGHSSSLVRGRAHVSLPDDVTPNWVPDPDGEVTLRIPLANQLLRLEQLHSQHQGVEPRVLPFRWQPYRHLAHDPDDGRGTVGTSLFSPDEWIIFQRSDGPVGPSGSVRYLPLGRGADLARRVRDVLLKYVDRANGAVPESVSGHTTTGARSQSPHLAVVPLAYVGARHADGKLRGVALIPPRGMTNADRVALLRGIGQWELDARERAETRAHNEDLDIPDVPVFMGRAGVAYLSRLNHAPNLLTLKPVRWSGPARTWHSVTPVALDRNPGDLHSRDVHTLARAVERAEASVRRACQRIGLPEPNSVSLAFSPAVSGTEMATRFPPFPARQQKGKPRRVLVHVSLVFHGKIEGPILLGAGRYYGLGLFLPVEADHDA